MAFFHFSQNNSGGIFKLTDTLTCHVIIEADSADDANERILSLGAYFDGVHSGSDCECCGDRWYPAWKDDGAPEPMVYGKKASEYLASNKFGAWMPEGKNIVVHYADGRVEWF